MATQSSAGAARTGGYLILRVIAGISTLCGWIAASLILLAVLITCQMIFVRFVLEQSTIWQTEAVIYMMIGATLLGLPYVQRMRGHVNVDLMPLWTHGRVRKALAIVVLLATIAVAAVMFWYGLENWHFAWDRNWRSETVWGVKLWIPYIAMPLGFGLYMLQLVADLVALIIGVDRAFGLEEH